MDVQHGVYLQFYMVNEDFKGIDTTLLMGRYRLL